MKYRGLKHFQIYEEFDSDSNENLHNYDSGKISRWNINIMR